MNERVVLPHRRESDGFEMIVRGMKLTVYFSRFPGTDRVAEIFCSSSAGSSDLENDVCDALVGASIALQHGADLNVFRKSMLRARNGRPAGILGEILDEVERRSMVPEGEVPEE